MIIDKDGKIAGKINIVDLVVILMLIVALLGISVRYIGKASKNAKNIINLSYVVEIEGIRSYTVDALEKRGVVCNSKDGKAIGEITDVEIKPMKVQTLLATGEIIDVEVPERYVADITVSAEAKETDSGYFVGENIELSVGGTTNMQTKYVNCFGKIKSISEAK